MNRRVPPHLPGAASLARLAVTIVAVVMTALVYDAGSAHAQTRSDRDPRFPVQPALPLPDRFSVPPRIVVPSGPRVEISPSQRVVIQGQPAIFDGKSIADPDVPISAYQWSGPARQASNSERFVVDTSRLKPSEYRITLVVRDRRQREGRDSATLIVRAKSRDDVNVDTRPPVARIQPPSTRVSQGARVSFSSTSYHPNPNARIVRSSWRTQWGHTAAGNSIEIDTRSLSPGTYWVALQVMDQREQRDSARAMLEVVAAGQPPVASISPKPLRVQQGEFAAFDGGRSSDRDGKIRFWVWTLDDKRIDGGPSARIDTRGLRPGEYRVRLQVTDDQGLTASDEALLIVAARAQDFDAALVGLDVSPAQTPPNREVQIRAVVANPGKTILRNLEVRFYILRAQIGRVVLPSLAPGQSREATATWLANLPGEHIVVAIVNPENQPPEANRTNNLRRRSIVVLPQPELRIDPAPLEVMQGDSANFSARVTFPPGQGTQSLDYFWRGPGNRGGNGPEFKFDTADLPPGVYKIALEIFDKRGFRSSTETNLTIRRPETELWIAANSQSPNVRRNVAFHGGIRPELSAVSYKFFFGDGEETDWRTTPEAEHRYEKAGEYRVRLLARRSGVDLGETSIGIRVQETAFAVSLRTDAKSVRTGDSVTFMASMEPPADNVEYLFRFGDEQESGWTRSPTESHSYSTNGTFPATVEARIGGAQLFRSSVLRINVAAPWPLWPWFALGILVIIAAAAAMRKKALPAPPAGSFSVVPRLNLEKLHVETQGKLDLDCAIGLRAVRGRHRYDIEAPGPLLGHPKD